MAKPTTKQRGGRKKGAWAETTPDAIRDFRRVGRISRSRLASALGVSSTSVQNWEVGLVVATPAMQRKIVEMLKNAPPELARPRPASARDGGGAEVEAAGQIVCAWLSQHPGTDEQELLTLIRAVRTALL